MQRPGRAVRKRAYSLVIPGLVPAIHVFLVVAGKQDVDGRERPGTTATNAFPRFCTSPAGRGPDPLAFRPFWPQIRTGRLAVDEPLANRVRSGREQPLR